MRFLALVIGWVLLYPLTAAAVNLTCTVPPGAATTRGAELCELLRQDMNVRNADWSNNACATEFLRRGLRNYEAHVTREAARQTVQNNVSTAITTFDANHQPAVVGARCGDSLVDDGRDGVDLGETCDDGNTTGGDGCDADCKLE